MLGLASRVPGAAATSGSIAEEGSTLAATAGLAMAASGNTVDGIWGPEDWGCSPDECLGGASAGRSALIGGMLGDELVAAEPELACTASGVTLVEGG